MVGKTISHYKILSKLAEDGMGVIYRIVALAILLGLDLYMPVPVEK